MAEQNFSESIAFQHQEIDLVFIEHPVLNANSKNPAFKKNAKENYGAVFDANLLKKAIKNALETGDPQSLKTLFTMGERLVNFSTAMDRANQGRDAGMPYLALARVLFHAGTERGDPAGFYGLGLIGEQAGRLQKNPQTYSDYMHAAKACYALAACDDTVSDSINVKMPERSVVPTTPFPEAFWALGKLTHKKAKDLQNFSKALNYFKCGAELGDLRSAAWAMDMNIGFMQKVTRGTDTHNQHMAEAYKYALQVINPRNEEAPKPLTKGQAQTYNQHLVASAHLFLSEVFRQGLAGQQRDGGSVLEHLHIAAYRYGSFRASHEYARDIANTVLLSREDYSPNTRKQALSIVSRMADVEPTAYDRPKDAVATQAHTWRLLGDLIVAKKQPLSNKEASEAKRFFGHAVDFGETLGGYAGLAGLQAGQLDVSLGRPNADPTTLTKEADQLVEYYQALHRVDDQITSTEWALAYDLPMRAYETALEKGHEAAKGPLARLAFECGEMMQKAGDSPAVKKLAVDFYQQAADLGHHWAKKILETLTLRGKAEAILDEWQAAAKDIESVWKTAQDDKKVRALLVQLYAAGLVDLKHFDNVKTGWDSESSAHKFLNLLLEEAGTKEDLKTFLKKDPKTTDDHFIRLAASRLYAENPDLHIEATLKQSRHEVAFALAQTPELPKGKKSSIGAKESILRAMADLHQEVLTRHLQDVYNKPEAAKNALEKAMAHRRTHRHEDTMRAPSIADGQIRQTVLDRAVAIYEQHLQA